MLQVFLKRFAAFGECKIWLKSARNIVVTTVIIIKVCRQLYCRSFTIGLCTWNASHSCHAGVSLALVSFYFESDILLCDMLRSWVQYDLLFGRVQILLNIRWEYSQYSFSLAGKRSYNILDKIDHLFARCYRILQDISNGNIWKVLECNSELLHLRLMFWEWSGLGSVSLTMNNGASKGGNVRVGKKGNKTKKRKGKRTGGVTF